MNVRQLVEYELAGETKVIGETLPKCHFIDHKVLNPTQPWWGTLKEETIFHWNFLNKVFQLQIRD